MFVASIDCDHLHVVSSHPYHQSRCGSSYLTSLFPFPITPLTFCLNSLCVHPADLRFTISVFLICARTSSSYLIHTLHLNLYPYP